MTFGITATGLFIGGTALAGGYMASQGAKSAASTQAGAAAQAADVQAQSNKEALALQRQMYDEQKALQEPYRAAGLTAQNRLMTLLGLQGAPQNVAQGASTGGGLFGSIAGQIAPFVRGATPSTPYVGGDVNAADFGAANREFSMAGFDPNSLMKNFSASDFQQDPGYAFRLSEGLKGLDRSAAARGGLISGGALKAATQYGQEMGSQEYQNAFNRFQAGRATQGQEYGNAFNRFQTNRTNMLQPLGNLMASGQNAASNQGAAAGAYGSSGANLLTGAGQAMAGGITGAGQATAAGQLGSANTLGNMLTGGASAYQQQQNFNQWLGNQNNPYGTGGAPTTVNPYQG
jgi:hypothetical protein